MEEKKIKRIGVLTSGGDSPGMNAVIRAVVRAATANDISTVGIKKGFIGIMDEDFIELDNNSVADKIHTGGTFLYTSRCDDLKTYAGQKKAADILKKHGIDCLVVIGGDGSFHGARRLTYQGIDVMCIPCTIDNDIACTDYTIGFDTAVNTAVEAIDKMRSTSISHERCSIIEVMGRGSGFIAMWCGIASGAEDILVPEKYDGDFPRMIDELSRHIMINREKGKTHHIIVNAEGIGHTYELAKEIEKRTGIETRSVVIGHIQRGGSPTVKDRMLASSMGTYAIKEIARGNLNRVIALSDNEITSYTLEEAILMKKDISQFLYEVADMMVR